MPFGGAKAGPFRRASSIAGVSPVGSAIIHKRIVLDAITKLSKKKRRNKAGLL